jgi:4-amino-4-deoxy-L-arabinose transferase-like glycosyltransferase
MSRTRSVAIMKQMGRGWPEAVLAILTCAAFFGSLGSIDLWSQAEQRATAGAIDTLDHHHWLVAQVGGQPRVGEPPMTRWMLAGLMAATGERAEWVVRIPGALSGLAIVALIYGLGRRLGGRPVGLASAFVLCSMGYFVAELRQAGDIGPQALLMTLVICAVWKRLDGSVPKADRGGLRLLYVSMGLGFLTGGFSFLLIAAVTILGAFATARRVRWGLGRVWDLRGFALFATVALSWPAAVMIGEPGAGQLWLGALGTKLMALRLTPWLDMTRFAGIWPELVLPWSPIALFAVFLPFLPLRLCGGVVHDEHAREASSPVYWLMWWWAMASLVAFSPWTSSHAADLVPCLPGMSLLIGDMWVRLARVARDRTAGMLTARVVLQAQWVLLFFVAGVFPLFSRALVPTELWPWSLAISASVAAATIVSVVVWRRGADALALAPITTALVASLWIVYGVAAPTQNSLRSHRALGQTIHRVIPGDVHTVAAFDEIDDGVRFYLKDLDLAPLPTGQAGEGSASAASAQVSGDRLIAWLDGGHPGSSFVLLRDSVYSRIAARLGRRVTPVLREAGLKRDELVLLRVEDSLATRTAISDEPTRR